ncbi:hypothetical protein C8J56DRAFT_290790 [Mycena floridula]|nr:hypothetical protein C8J56DRAFT_290790 [Mycena floridula]
MLLPTFLSFTAGNLLDSLKDPEMAETKPDIQVSTKDLYESNQGTYDHDSDDRLDPRIDFPAFTPSAEASPSWYSKLKALFNPDEDEDIADILPKYRYTPILSGIIIPLSILLDIPGLTEHWYVRTLGHETVETRPNPRILDIGLACSMACGVAANAALIVRFLEKRVKLMTILCISFLTLHDVINIVAITVFGVEHRFDDGFTYGQSFWLTVCSTVASTFTNLTLISDLHWTSSFDNSGKIVFHSKLLIQLMSSIAGSGLTRKQRSLIVVVMGLLCYISLGSLIHGFLMHLTFIDSLYFTICTIETIGFGDIILGSTGARVFSCFYACFGIFGLALCISLSRETIVEALEVEYRKRVQALRERRRVANWKRRVFRRWKEAIYWRLKEENKPLWVRDKVSRNSVTEFLSNCRSRLPFWHSTNTWFGKDPFLSNSAHPHGMHLNLEALSGPQLEAAAMEVGVPLNALLPPLFWKRHQIGNEPSDNVPIPDMEMPLTQARLGRMISVVVNLALAVQGAGWAKSPGLADGFTSASIGMTPTLTRGTTLTRATTLTGTSRPSSPTPNVSLSQQYDTFRTSLEKEEKKAFYARLTVVWILFFTFWMLGSVVLMKTEEWSFGIAAYFCFIAFSTIGYGDFSPKSLAGRAFFVAWALFGVATMTILISVLAEAYSSRYKHFFHSNVFDRAVKRYRARLTRPRRNRPPPPHLINPGAVESSGNREHPVIDDPRRRAQDQLEALPYHMLALTREFHEHMQFFQVHPSIGEMDNSKLPDVIQQLLDEITGMDNMVIGERHKLEILEDTTSRQALFTLGIEKAIRKMSHTAEEVIDVLGERDYIMSLQEEKTLMTSSHIEEVCPRGRKTA